MEDRLPPHWPEYALCRSSRSGFMANCTSDYMSERINNHLCYLDATLSLECRYKKLVNYLNLCLSLPESELARLGVINYSTS